LLLSIHSSDTMILVLSRISFRSVISFWAVTTVSAVDNVPPTRRYATTTRRSTPIAAPISSATATVFQLPAGLNTAKSVDLQIPSGSMNWKYTVSPLDGEGILSVYTVIRRVSPGSQYWLLLVSYNSAVHVPEFPLYP